jgi:hypothetical protein
MDDELESWIYLDGPEPEPVREMLDLLRELPPATAEDVDRMERTFFATLDAQLPDTPEAPPPVERGQDAPPPQRMHHVELAQPDSEDADPSNVVQPPPPPAQLAPAAPAGPSLHVKPPADLARTQQSAGNRPPSLGDRLPLGDNTFARAVAAFTFAPSPAGGQDGGLAGPQTPAALTFGGLTVEQYAWLRAELAIMPEAEAEILAKYRVGARAAVDDLWQLHLAHNPQSRAVFEENFARFTTYLRELYARTRHRGA